MSLLGRSGFVVALSSWLGFCAGADGAVFTVGPTGQFTTIQAALDAAFAAGGDNEVRVAQGSYAERLVVHDPFLTTALALRGGWDASFSTQTLDPKTTIVDAESLGRALKSVSRFHFVIEALTFRRGRLVNNGDPALTSDGGGVNLAAYGGSLSFRNCRVEDSEVLWDGDNPARAGGMWVDGNAPIEILDSSFARNSARALRDNQAAYAGTLLTVTTGPLLLARLTITDSRTESDYSASGAVNVSAQGGKAVVEDVTISGSNNVGRPVEAQAIGLFAGTAGSIDARRLRVSGSTPKKATDGFDPIQVYVSTFGSGSLRLADSLIYGGRNGLYARADSSGFLRLVNLTITGHTGVGVTLDNVSKKALLLANSIVSGNKSDLGVSGKISQVQNLIGKDPKFVDPKKKKDFRLQASSPAANAGSLKVGGGLSETDLAGLPRIKNSKVDQGAYESQ